VGGADGAGSALYVFDDEVEALRFVNSEGYYMEVLLVPHGEDALLQAGGRAMTGAEQIVIISASGVSSALSVATIATLRKSRYTQQTIELFGEATRRWEALAKAARQRAQDAAKARGD